MVSRMTTSSKRQDPLLPFVALTAIAALGMMGMALRVRAFRMHVEALVAENRRLWTQLPKLPRIRVPDEESFVPQTTESPYAPGPMPTAYVLELTGPISKDAAEKLIQGKFLPSLEACARHNQVAEFSFAFKISQSAGDGPTGTPEEVVNGPAAALGCAFEATRRLSLPRVVGRGQIGIDLVLTGPDGPGNAQPDAPAGATGPGGPFGPWWNRDPPPPGE
jgi:hypothetical protein